MKCPKCGKEDYRKFPALLIKTCFDCFAAPLIKAELEHKPTLINDKEKRDSNLSQPS
jgi:hypothetical protein